MKCIHPDCTNDCKHGICDGHISLIKNPGNSVLLCSDCGSLIAVFKKDQYPTNRKYHWCFKCRQCGGTKEDEVILKEDSPV